MPACEEAIGFASLEFSKCLPERHSIQDRSLFVEGHVLDEVDEVIQLEGPLGTIGLITRLRQLFDDRECSSFDSYPCRHPGSSDKNIHTVQLQDSHAESVTLLSDYDDTPSRVIGVLIDIVEKGPDAASDTVLNIEAMWLALLSTQHKRGRQPARNGHRLPLAVLYWYFVLHSGQHQPSVKAELPKLYVLWIRLALLLLYTARSSINVAVRHGSHVFWSVLGVTLS